ncbi:hypothetical protein D3C75_1040640 [compost metagenome]
MELPGQILQLQLPPELKIHILNDVKYRISFVGLLQFRQIGHTLLTQPVHITAQQKIIAQPPEISVFSLQLAHQPVRVTVHLRDVAA